MAKSSTSAKGSTPSPRRQNRQQGLTHLGFERLLALFGIGDAVRNERYSRLRRNLIHFFSKSHCPFPEDLADEVIERVARRLEEGIQVRAEALQFYCGGVARILYREFLRDRHAQADRASRLAVALGEWAEPAGEWRERQLACLDDCLALLTAGERLLLLAYYQGNDLAEERQKICRERSVSPNSLRLRTHRLRRRVETELRARLFGGAEPAGGEAGRHPGRTRDSSSRQTAPPSW